jgi:hypothetical protein
MPSGPFAKFREVNYLYYDEPFNRIKALADANRISTGYLDLNDFAAVAMLVTNLAAQKIPLSVLDISNAWWKAYTQRALLAATLTEFDKIARDDSIFLATSQSPFVAVAHGTIDRTPTPFSYSGYTFKYIRSSKTTEKFLDGLKWEWMYRLSLGANLDSIPTPPGPCALPLMGKP